ncbi:MAG: type III-A CRISPR-associated RAMP protein Csm5 [Zoogloeaceae bacterium]|jgi:CRISPR-associated protein Csm5|nr:type III-A CRISPR-associated RAMP protein Csm5 [Zoogloeaceae bacterium]
MNEFLIRHKVALTPLSPIHIGCGEDFEPTNYVIDAEKKLLYGFDPSRAVLPEQLAGKLASLGEKGNLLGIQQFFRDNQDRFRPLFHILMSVASGVARDYGNKIGRVANLEAGGNRVFNQFTIERHAHSRNTPYIPGSSLKGALRTALMDRLNNGQPVTDKDEKRNSAKLAMRLLDGDFSTSPLRLLKVGDLMSGERLDRSVLYAVNRYKRPKFDRATGQEKSPKGIVARKECILPGQYRALTAEITVQDLGNKGNAEDKRNVPRPAMRPNLAQIARDSNAYHLPRLRAELAEMDKTGLVNPDWKRAIEALLNSSLEIRLEEGKAMLVRLGRYGGAESKTLTQAAEIKIMGKQGQPPKYLPRTTTYWLAAQTADDRKHLLPFGWAILEVDPQGDLPELKTWCESEAQNRPDIGEHYSALTAAKTIADARLAEQKLEHEAQRQAEEASAKREQGLATLSEAGREIEKFKNECAKIARSTGGKKGKPYGTDYNRARLLVEKARTGGAWSVTDKQAAAEAIEHWLPRLEMLEVKDLRKKLKLAELAGGVAGSLQQETPNAK